MTVPDCTRSLSSGLSCGLCERCRRERERLARMGRNMRAAGLSPSAIAANLAEPVRLGISWPVPDPREVIAPEHRQPGDSLSLLEMRLQAIRCACRGYDSMCACQNEPDDITSDARLGILPPDACEVCQDDCNGAHPACPRKVLR